MPRPKKPGQEDKEVKKRSRNGCWPCKTRKVKCGEEKPTCINCQRQGETCDYSIRLNWDGRSKKKDDGNSGSQTIAFESGTFAPKNSPPNGLESMMLQATDSFLNADNGSVRSNSPYASSVDRGNTLPPLPDFISNPPLPTPAFEPTQPASMSGQASLWPLPTLANPFQAATQNPSLRNFANPPSYPSPGDSSFESPNAPPNPFQGNGTMQMLPPLPTSNPSANTDVSRSPRNGNKRIKLSPTFAHNPNRLYRASSYGPGEYDEVQRPSFQPLTPMSIPAHLSNPLTPAASSTTSDDMYNKWLAKTSPKPPQEEEVRRVSVSSLLSGEPEPEDTGLKIKVEAHQGASPDNRPIGLYHHRSSSSSQTETYGLDRGLPDLDLPKNNDTSAITGVSPSESSELEAWLNDFDMGIPEFGFGLQKRAEVFARGGYYASPVPIKIPRKLEPLPSTLLENPMNLLYFHHFLNHTARILVPHDCSENPFKTILPQMAVENKNLLHLLLAYSASHRARLLCHPEPGNRIALWVQDVFPSLRLALDDLSNTEISNANLATAIMLSSLEIISPSTFGVPVPWQQHLSVARSIIKLQGGGPKSVSRKDSVTYFLTRWLAYLDVLGSLSGHRNEEPLFGGNYWRRSSTAAPVPLDELLASGTDDEADYTIDCLLGFTTRCVSILAHIASLARHCDWQRIDAQTGMAKPTWRPPPHILAEADELRRDLENAMVHPQTKCPHHVADDPDHRDLNGGPDGPDERDTGLGATNAAFHWAGLVHLLRRIHNMPKSAPEVQNAVRSIVDALEKVPKGGSAEACLLFPMFTAGVEAEDHAARDMVLARVKGVEEVGMCQVGRARQLMEKVWKTGKEWEGLVKGEFFG